MEIPVKRIRERTFPWPIVMMLVIFGGTTGCTTLKTNQSEDGRVRNIWEAREQYVAIERQDHPAGVTVSANAHPADLSVERLRSALESIEVQIPGKDKNVSLFNDPELKVLSEKIREGFFSAGPNKDVTFAVIGHYPALLGLMQERKVTTGRVFCLDGQLNIIFGDVLRDVKESEDRRLYPFRAGSRAVAASGKWSMTKKPDGENFTVKRTDWLTFPLASPAATVVTPATGHNAGNSLNKAALPTVSPAKPATAVNKSVEKRLMILNDLWHKKLVTDEEYQTKRREILNEF
jgi:hypothetical protein